MLSSHTTAYVKGKTQYLHSLLDLPKPYLSVAASVGDGLDFSVNKLSVKSLLMKLCDNFISYTITL